MYNLCSENNSKFCLEESADISIKITTANLIFKWRFYCIPSLAFIIAIIYNWKICTEIIAEYTLSITLLKENMIKVLNK